MPQRPGRWLKHGAAILQIHLTCSVYRLAICSLLLGLSFPGWAADASTTPEGSARYVLSLRLAQQLALSNNSIAVNSQLDRSVQRLQRAVGEHDLQPQFSLSGQVDRPLSGPTNGSTGTSASVVANAAMKLPNSTVVSLSSNLSRTSNNGLGNQQVVTQILQLIQPLMKDFGPRQATLVRDQARLNDASALFQQEQILDNLYQGVTLAYLDAVQARQQTIEAQRAAARATENLRVNQSLQQAGRIPRLDVVQSQTESTQANLSLAQAQNTQSATTSRLLQWLGPAMANLSAEDVVLDDAFDGASEALLSGLNMSNQSLDSFLAQRADWKVAQLAVRLAQMSEEQTINDFRPQLDAIATAQRDRTKSEASGASKGTDYAIGLRFSIPLDQPAKRLQTTQARVNVQKAELALVDLKNQIASEIGNARRDVQFTRQQVNLARQNLSLNEQRLQAEREKFQAGRSSAFQLSLVQDALNTATLTQLQAVSAWHRARWEYARVTGQLSFWRQSIIQKEP